MKPLTCVTTSWDDGHPLDLRVADLLAKYNLQGTFYVPKTAERETIEPSVIRELASHFEVGAHTLHHVDLTRVSQESSRREILDSKSWLEDVTGKPCTMFCFPRGKFRRSHLPFIREANYTAARTVELLSVDVPTRQDGILLMPTSVQAFPHQADAYLMNLAKRAAFRNLGLYLRYYSGRDWWVLSESLARRAAEQGGVLHLWGHSWEIEEQKQWRRLEEVFQFLSQMGSEVLRLTNSGICGSIQRSSTDQFVTGSPAGHDPGL